MYSEFQYWSNLDGFYAQVCDDNPFEIHFAWHLATNSILSKSKIIINNSPTISTASSLAHRNNKTACRTILLTSIIAVIVATYWTNSPSKKPQTPQMVSTTGQAVENPHEVEWLLALIKACSLNFYALTKGTFDAKIVRKVRHIEGLRREMQLPVQQKWLNPLNYFALMISVLFFNSSGLTFTFLSEHEIKWNY